MDMLLVYTKPMIRVRFAPSPTGFVHIGSIWQVLVNYAYARHNNGKFIIRLEDTDQKRFVEGAEESIYNALEWFGLTPDEGPKHGGEYSPYRQSERLSIYKKHAEELIEKGYAYHCFCSPERLAEVRDRMQKAKQPPMYDKHCRNLPKDEVEKRIKSGEKYVVRLKVPVNETIVVEDLLRGNIEFDSNTVDDQILLKSDGFPTYHLAAIVDDHLMEISHVVRGSEWLPSAPKHFLLYKYFGWKPPVFVHTPVILNPGGKGKLSKRHEHAGVEWYQQNGYLPEAILNFLALLGWSHPEGKTVFSLDEFIKLFDLVDLNPTAPVFDLTKLEWMNGEYIRAMENTQLIERAKQYFHKKATGKEIKQVIPLIKERIKTLREIPSLTNFFFEAPHIDKELLCIKKHLLEEGKETLKELYRVLDSLDEPWTHESWEQAVRTLADNLEWKHGDLFMLLRIAITGSKISPPLFESLIVLGKKEILKRLK